MTNEIVRKGIEYGVNYFDTAQVYDDGNAEIALGNALKELKVRREEVVIGTKIFWESITQPTHVNATGLSRKHLIEGIKKSLKRLQLDYVDILFAHRSDYNTPLEETVKAFSWIID